MTGHGSLHCLNSSGTYLYHGSTDDVTQCVRGCVRPRPTVKCRLPRKPKSELVMRRRDRQTEKGIPADYEGLWRKYFCPPSLLWSIVNQWEIVSNEAEREDIIYSVFVGCLEDDILTKVHTNVVKTTLENYLVIALKNRVLTVHKQFTTAKVSEHLYLQKEKQRLKSELKGQEKNPLETRYVSFDLLKKVYYFAEELGREGKGNKKRYRYYPRLLQYLITKGDTKKEKNTVPDLLDFLGLENNFNNYQNVLRLKKEVAGMMRERFDE